MTDPTEVRPEMKDLAKFGRYFDIARAKISQFEIGDLKRLANGRDLLPVETHQSRGDEIDGHRVGTRDEDTAGLGVGFHRPVALTGNDAVNDGQIPQGLRAWFAGAVEMPQRFIEVQRHAPRGVVAPPVAAAHDLRRVTEHARADMLGNGRPELGGGAAALRGSFEGSDGMTLELRRRLAVGKLVAAFVGCADAEVW